MRIVGGRLRGARLAGPGEDGGGEAHLRPTSDRVREALFNALAHGGYAEPPVPEGMRVLDLFAGTGALGLEALSRGAARVLFVDDLGKARALIRENIEKLRVIGETRIYRRDATKLGECRGEAYDLIFLDPPYGQGLGEKALASAREGGWIALGALIVWEEAAGASPDLSCFTLLDERSYGGTVVRILRSNEAN